VQPEEIEVPDSLTSFLAKAVGDGGLQERTPASYAIPLPNAPIPWTRRRKTILIVRPVSNFSFNF
jgi:hypothetical protein